MTLLRPAAAPSIPDGAALRRWREERAPLGEHGGGQTMMARLLGLSTNQIREIEAGRQGIPKLLPLALVVIQKPLQVAARRELRRRAASRERSRVRRNAKRRTAHAKAARASQRARQRAIEQFRHRRGVEYRRHAAESLRVGAAFVRQLERQGKIREPGTPILKRPRDRIVMPRKIRKDAGKKHKWRGRPGYPLRPEDLIHAAD